MPFSNETIRAGIAARRSLIAAEAAHPNCPHLADLHGKLQAVVNSVGRPILSPGDFAALGGGTPKTPPPDED